VEILDVQTYVSHKKIINLRKANDPVNQRGGAWAHDSLKSTKGEDGLLTNRWSLAEAFTLDTH